MTFTPSDITGSVITWEPTAELRFAGPRRKKAELQQLWVNRSTEEQEWREICFVHQQENGD